MYDFQIVLLSYDESKHSSMLTYQRVDHIEGLQQYARYTHRVHIVTVILGQDLLFCSQIYSIHMTDLRRYSNFRIDIKYVGKLTHHIDISIKLQGFVHAMYFGLFALSAVNQFTKKINLKPQSEIANLANLTRLKNTNTSLVKPDKQFNPVVATT